MCPSGGFLYNHAAGVYGIATKERMESAQSSGWEGARVFACGEDSHARERTLSLRSSVSGARIQNLYLRA